MDYLVGLQKILSTTVMVFGNSAVTIGTILFLAIGFSIIIVASKNMQKRLIEPFLVKNNLKGSLAEKLCMLLHLILIGGCGIFIIDRSELDMTAVQILHVINQIMSEPLIPIGKTSVTLWSIVYVSILTIVLLIITGRLQLWVVDNAFQKSKIDVGTRYGVSMIAKYIVLGLGFMVILQSAGIDLSSLTIMAGALGLGLSFGLQNIVANFVSGFTILMERPVKVGDRIEVDGVLGNVSKIKLRSTTIITNDNIEIIVPNTEFISSKVTNLSHSSKEIRLNFPFGVSYNSDPKKVKSIVEQVALDHKGILKKPVPMLVFREFGESSLNFEIRVWTKEYAKTPDILQSELLFAIFDALKENNIEIPFPQRDIHIKSGSL
ncbi:MAG: mechanosensitive ion channel [Cyanobacteriota/Melainabacteria group bacterium]